MRFLLDTQVLLWTIGNSTRLRPSVRGELEDEANEVFFSPASIWEIAIKFSLRRSDFSISPVVVEEEARTIGFTVLPVSIRSACSVAELPFHHRDPFDRVLVAQAMTEVAYLYTADTRLLAYSELVRLAS
ncbi:MAG: type II toxin-antitoxin system VapC family toxin [Alphaproteobacteria bacterium]|nr:type II toxin-antitoxin system VapC family toxin [Alphaproteobacteria bacterium]